MDHDRRVSLREPFSQLITIKVESGSKTSTYQAEIIDASPIGARIRTLAEVEPGDSVEFFSADDPAHPARYLVAWTGRRGSDLEGLVGLRILASKLGEPE
ncbi:MAG: PilZ domain-containing protein [Terriglobia bacterium]|jgi:hypothetical protein